MRKLVRFLLWVAILCGVAIAVARYFAIRWWRVPDDDPYLEASIAPTLRGGDLVILWRFTAPGFGSLVVCPEPDAAHRQVIGRIAAEPGDTIKVDASSLQINRAYASTDGTCDPFTVNDPSTGAEIEMRCSIEVLGGSGHMRGQPIASKPQKPHEREVAEGKVFLLSDNRLFPYDSRDFGLVDRETCKETVVFRLVGKAGFSDTKSRFTFIH